MARLTIEQVRGLKDLIQDGVEAGVNATEEVHRGIAGKPYALLKGIPLIAKPVGALEQLQGAVTSGVYHAIRLGNRLTGALATHALDAWENASDGAPGEESPSLAKRKEGPAV